MSLLQAHVLSRLVREDLGHYALGTNSPEASYKQIAAGRLLDSLLKKHVDEVDARADDKALEKFLSCNERCKSWTLDDKRSLVEDVILGEMRDIIYRFWMVDSTSSLCDNVQSLLDEARHGPGASVGGLGTDFYTKQFSGPLVSSSALLLHTYQRWIDARSLWRFAEMRRAWEYGRITATSYLTFVPKSNEISRTICVEPSLNMFFQQGLKNLLEKRMKRVFRIDLKDQQQRNRELAKIGSLDGSLATIDLSSASDSISLKMLQYLLPVDFYRLLGLLRCQETRLPSGEVIPLHMVSTMGNAFTFPLQCIIFASCIKATFKVMGIPWETCRLKSDSKFVWRDFSQGEWRKPTVGVNGDDLIVPTICYKMVTRMLGILGFTVNAEKSFSEGYFRESCGADWFQGRPVRGVYLQDQSTPDASYVTWNKLSSWSAQTGLPLPRALSYVLRTAERLEVPWYESDSAGFKVADRSRRQHLRSEGGGTIYRKIEPRTRALKFVRDDSGKTADGHFVRVPSGEKARVFNPFGYLLCYLGGYITSDTITLRDKRPRWRVRSCETPSEWELTSGTADEAVDPLALRCARSTA